MRLNWKRANRVRVHLAESTPGVELPSVEGLLVAKRRDEYVIAKPALIVNAAGNPTLLESNILVIPRERVAFYEVVR